MAANSKGKEGMFWKQQRIEEKGDQVVKQSKMLPLGPGYLSLNPLFTHFSFFLFYKERRRVLKLSTRGMLQFKIPGIRIRKELAEADTCELLCFQQEGFMRVTL